MTEGELFSIVLCILYGAVAIYAVIATVVEFKSKKRIPGAFHPLSSRFGEGFLPHTRIDKEDGKIIKTSKLAIYLGWYCLGLGALGVGGSALADSLEISLAETINKTTNTFLTLAIILLVTGFIGKAIFKKTSSNSI